MLAPAVHRESSQFVRLEPAAQGREILRALFGLDAAALAAVIVEMGEPAYRGRQLAEAIYRQRITEISLISTLPLELRRRLDESGWQVGRPRIAQIFKSIDGTERYLVDCDEESAQTVETVWMPEGDGGETGEEAEQDEGAPSFRSSSGDRVGEQESSTTRIKETWSRATICVSSPGWLRSQLPVLPHGQAGPAAQSDGRARLRDRWFRCSIAMA